MRKLLYARRSDRTRNRNKYFPLAYVALVTFFLSAAALAIYAGLSECEKSAWVVLGTVAAIVCDILEAVAIECTILITVKWARELLCQLVLSIMRIG